ERRSRRSELAGGVNVKAGGKPHRFQPRPVLPHLGVFLRALDSSRARRFRKGPAEFRMVGRAVITLAIVLPDELPVASLDDRALISELRLGEAVRRKIGLHDLPKGGEIGGG